MLFHSPTAGSDHINIAKIIMSHVRMTRKKPASTLNKKVGNKIEWRIVPCLVQYYTRHNYVDFMRTYTVNNVTSANNGL